ncbi:MAG: Ig-like domain-containing protein, partial [Chloroflexota bacterium]
GGWSANVYTSDNAGTWTVTGSYSGKTDTAILTVNPGPVASIVISPDTTTITAGGSQTYTAEAFDAFGNSLGDVTPGTTFSIESGAGGSWGTNEYTSEFAGTWTVTGEYSGKTDTAILTVTAGPLDYIIVSPDTATITAGSSQSYIAEAFDAFGNSLGDVTPGTTFSIESGAGGSWGTNEYTSEFAGTWTVTGEYNGKADTATLVVSMFGLDYIIVSPDTATITAGDSQSYIAEAFDAFGNSLGDVTSGTTFSIHSGAGGSWSANDYTSEFVGTWTVTGEYSGKTDTAILVVTVGEAGILILEPATAINEINTNHELTATVTDQYGNPVSGETVTWIIEDGPGSFVSTETTTDSNGQVLAVITSDTGGVTTVKASVSETVYDTATKTWSEEPLQYFTVDFLGEITSVPMSDDGSILEPLAAPNPDHTHWFEMEQGTRVLDDAGNIITFIEIRITDDPPLEGADVIVGATYIINPPNATFSKPVILTLGYGIDELPEDVSFITISSYETIIGWIDLEAESNVVAGVGELSTDIEKSGVFAIIAEVTPQKSPAGFALDTLRISPSATKFWGILTFAIRVGEDADIRVFVNNYGGEKGIYTASLMQNGNVIAKQEVSIPAGQRQMISFNLSEIEPGDYKIKIGDWYVEFSSTLWINWWLIAGLASALIVIVWAAWYYGFHNRKQKVT